MWTRTQEQPGSCRFDSYPLTTPGVLGALDASDIASILATLRRDVAAHGGLDYLQVFTSSDGRKVWVIDDHTHWTLLLPSEY